METADTYLTFIEDELDWDYGPLESSEGADENKWLAHATYHLADGTWIKVTVEVLK